MNQVEKPKVHITKMKFNDGHEYEFLPSDIVVFVGSNNAGKSQVLRDIELFFSNRESTRIIASDIEIALSGNPNYFIEHSIEKHGHFVFDGVSAVNVQHFLDWWNERDVQVYKNYILNFLTTEQRLLASKPVNSYDAANEAPTNPIQELYAKDTKENEISEMFKCAFGQDIIINRGAGSIIPIHVGQKPDIEEGEDRVSESYLKKLNEVPQAQVQGDGVRSFLGVLLNVFVNPHSIILIDEPEAFLHPPQARLLGKILAERLNERCQIFISSHSGDFIKGLLDSGNNQIKIVHINRDCSDINHVSLLANREIANIWKDPILHFSNILDGLFHSKVVICESDSDCRFYQALLNACYGDDDVSGILFVHCGGKQRLKVVVDALRALDVKTIAVADIDVMNDESVFKPIVESFDIVWSGIESKWKNVDNFARQLAISKNKNDVKKEIEVFLESLPETTLSRGSSEKIEEIVKFSSGWSSVKKVGKRAFTGGVYTDYNVVEDECKSHGLLIVPVGELEHFYKPFEALHGPKWTNKVLESVDLINDSELYEAREFVKSIIDF